MSLTNKKNGIAEKAIIFIIQINLRREANLISAYSPRREYNEDIVNDFQSDLVDCVQSLSVKKVVVIGDVNSMTRDEGKEEIYERRRKCY